MATINLAGIFQPSSLNGGSSLPQKTLSISSESNIQRNEVQLKPELKEVSKASLPLAEQTIETNTKNDKEEVQNEIEKLQQYTQSIDRSLQFKVDEELGVTIVRVVDKNTDELIRQFPPEELINLSRRLKELNDQNTGNTGILLQEKV